MLIFHFIQSIFNDINEPFSENEPQTDGIKSLYLLANGYNAKYYYNWKVVDYIILALLYIIAFLISIGAAYLSYTCTWKGSVQNVFFRMITAFFAFMLGPIYIIYYILFNYLGNLC